MKSDRETFEPLPKDQWPDRTRFPRCMGLALAKAIKCALEALSASAPTAGRERGT
jgi:hypothetical protein